MWLRLENLMQKNEQWQKSSEVLFLTHHLITIWGDMNKKFLEIKNKKLKFSKHQ